MFDFMVLLSVNLGMLFIGYKVFMSFIKNLVGGF